MQITYGRYTECFKQKVQLDYWGECGDLFEQKKYFDSFKIFTKYISNQSGDNINLTESDNSLKFDFIQGSKKVNVIISDKKVSAEAVIAECEKLSIPFMRRLLELNYTLYYSRFTLKENYIAIKFDSSISDCFPGKLYYALKELSIKADKQDDLLLGEFSVLKPVDSLIIPFDDKIKKLKLNFLRKWINETLDKISGLNENNYDGGISYLLLSLLYRVDYLLTPEGSIVDEMEKISMEYFTKDDKKHVEKNSNMKDKFAKILTKTDDELLKSFYKTNTTFSILNPVFLQPVADVIVNNLKNVGWYVDNKHEDIALRILEYVAGFCFYNYGMQTPVHRLLQVVYPVILPEFFKEAGDSEILFDEERNKLNIPAIKTKIELIVNAGVGQFPELKYNTDNLKFDSRINFLISFYNELKTLKLN